MNQLLNDKLNEIISADKESFWYLVKHRAEFAEQCYAVSILEKYQLENRTDNFETYFKSMAESLALANIYNISPSYRILAVGRFYGLIPPKPKEYPQVKITDTYYEIKKRCNGQFKDISLYQDIIERQIEKMYVSTSLDRDQAAEKRKDFRLFPAMLLYKILLEIGQYTGKYEISNLEYNLFVRTTPKYEKFLDTLIIIKLFRDSDTDTKKEFEKYIKKFEDSRMHLALEQLPAIERINGTFRLKDAYIPIIYNKITDFEQNHLSNFDEDEYFTFLGSVNSLGSLKNKTTTNLTPTKDGCVTGGQNIILYGVPGSGKSHTIQAEYCANEEYVERVVFHPDYTYSDFIGQISPVVNKDGNVSYKFVAGPFTKILKRAMDNPNTPYYLIIEELNRGNAPSIFGDIFQLLDRLENGESKYDITNSDISAYVYDEDNRKIKIPSNLSILATMNTSDQNVFTLDNAFQRRWNMRLIRNSFDKHPFSPDQILDTSVSWEKFCSVINKEILKNNSLLTASEDKRMGVYFITKADLSYDKKRPNNCLFAEKVIKYLWDDAFKFSRDTIFNIHESDSLEEILDWFITKKGDSRFDIFKDEIKTELISQE